MTQLHRYQSLLWCRQKVSSLKIVKFKSKKLKKLNKMLQQVLKEIFSIDQIYSGI